MINIGDLYFHKDDGRAFRVIKIARNYVILETIKGLKETWECSYSENGKLHTSKLILKAKTMLRRKLLNFSK